MLRQLLVIGVVSVFCVAVHALAMTLVVRGAQNASTRHVARPMLRLAGIMIATVLLLKIAHLTEIVIWTFSYWIVDAAPVGADLLYFAFVNYTTLGYGDVLPVSEWRLLGPATAMNGILLFGWSTAVIFDVLRRAMSSRTAASDI